MSRRVLIPEVVSTGIKKKKIYIYIYFSGFDGNEAKFR
jgi:hypothetical protein